MFKVGDRVVCTETTNWIEQGSVGIITEIGASNCTWVYWEAQKDTWAINQHQIELEKASVPEYTGGSSSYYKVDVVNPVSGGTQYVVECQDVIEALGMSFAEGNIFKGIWRICAAKKGKAKKGYVDSVYDLEKIIFFAQRELELEKLKAKG